MNIEIDRSQWSLSSQRHPVGHYDEKALYYENIAYHCKKCGKSCLFTAEQQKQIYEEYKKYIWWLPSFCLSCEEQRRELRHKINKCQFAWNNRKDILSENRKFLEYWKNLLKEMSSKIVSSLRYKTISSTGTSVLLLPVTLKIESS